MMHLNRRVFNTPLLILENSIGSINSYLLSRMKNNSNNVNVGLENHFGKSEKRGRFFRVENGIAIIPVVGALVNRWGNIDANCVEVSSYMDIRDKIQGAIEDPKVESIVLDIDSPGGEMPGAFDLADFIFKSREKKRIVAVANELCVSAAYLIGSSASKLYAPRTASIGSIGVLWQHLDFSKALENDGVNMTFCFSGDRKIEGNPFQPLPDGVKARVQNDLDEIYQLFVSAVARNMDIDKKRIRETQAGVFLGAEAKEKKLITGIKNLDSVLQSLTENRTKVRQGNRKAVSIEMYKSEEKMNEQEVIGVSENTDSVKKIEGNQDLGYLSEQVEIEKTRIKKILGLDSAKGKTELAEHLAFNTSMSVDEVEQILVKAPKLTEENDGLSKKMNAQLSDELGSLSDSPNVPPHKSISNSWCRVTGGNLNG